MKENIIVGIAIIGMFLISMILEKYKTNPKFNFAFSIIGILVFSGIFINDVIKRKNVNEMMVPFLLTIGLIAYLLIKAIRSYKKFHKG